MMMVLINKNGVGDTDEGGYNGGNGNNNRGIDKDKGDDDGDEVVGSNNDE